MKGISIVFKGVSKETKVGSLAAIAITVLILGYNYMVGKDNPFKGSRKFYVVFDSAQGLADNTALMFNGYRIGQLRKLTLNENNKIVGTIEIFNDLKIPVKSGIKIESELLGGMSMRLIMARSNKYVEEGDTLLPIYAKDVMSLVNEKVAPIAAGADTLLQNLNKLINRASVQKAFDELPLLIASINQTIVELQSTISGMKPGVTASLDNLGKFTQNLEAYNKSIQTSLKSFEGVSKQLDSVNLIKLTKSIEGTVESLSEITNMIKSGEGTLGQLATDKTLYNNLTKTTESLNRMLVDFKAFPEKYIPIPGTRHQRKVAKQKSDAFNNAKPTNP